MLIWGLWRVVRVPPVFVAWGRLVACLAARGVVCGARAGERFRGTRERVWCGGRPTVPDALRRGLHDQDAVLVRAVAHPDDPLVRRERRETGWGTRSH